MPCADLTDGNHVFGYGASVCLMQVLRQCGSDLSRANVMKQAASLKDFRTEVLLPGIKINTSATDYAPIEAMQLVQFDGKEYKAIGDVVGK